MAYDIGKYRSKREKVLGVKRRGINFATLALMVSIIILSGLGVVVVPKSIAFFNNRHLDDAIYKMQGSKTWSQKVIPEVQNLVGVKNAATDNGGSRIVITFDKTITDTSKISAFFEQKGIQTVMLNRVSHQQRLNTLKKEAVF